MKSIEDYIVDRIYQFANYVLSKLVKPDITVETVTDLDFETIETLKMQYGIEGVILDVDETLRSDMKNIPLANQEWLKQIKSQLKVIVVSNGRDGKIKQYLEEQQIEYISLAHKPLRTSFIKACKKMNIKQEQVLVIGDSLFDDIYGGQRNNMKSALVKKVVEDDHENR